MKRFGDVVAVDGCSLEARRGRLLGFLGPNGAGKTTAMRAIFGLVALDSGSITWDGEPVGPLQRARFGYMPEERGLYPRMAAAEQLAYLARLHGVDAQRAGDRAERWLAELGLTDRAAHSVESLSHGNQQRVQLAAALVHGPELLVLDEPFSGLDPLGVEAMQAVLRSEVQRGRAIIFSSHQLDLVESICDDVVILHEGRDVLSGTLEEVRERSPSRDVEVGFADDEVIWKPEADLPGVDATESAPGLVRLSVPVGVEPEHVLHAARRAGEVDRFSFQPPRLSQLFREAVAA